METYSFGEWLKQRRKQLRLTQREVAAAAYCSPAMIRKIEADERKKAEVRVRKERPPEASGLLAAVEKAGYSAEVSE